MSDTWIVDMSDYFLPGGQLVDGTAGRLARHFGAIVLAACSVAEGEWAETSHPCRRRPGRRPCPGHIVVLRSDDTVRWRCTDCDDNGLIRGWRGSIWDVHERGFAWSG